jgi:undecaprenyl diphosphate synthase
MGSRDPERLSELAKSLKRETIPNHVAIIMDGNGRWARSRHRPRVFGHRKGADTVRMVVETSDQLGIKVLSLFAFSEENWGRPQQEVMAIMTLLNTYLLREREELKRNNVQLRTIGNVGRLPTRTQKIVRETEAMLSGNTGLVLNVALSYGGRSDLVEACRALARRVETGELAPSDINQEMISGALSTWDLPEPDLLIRTSGEQRISNFMLWQMAYTELYFTSAHWPEFSQDDYVMALREFQRRQRRFGLVVEDDEPLAVNEAHE